MINREFKFTSLMAFSICFVLTAFVGGVIGSVLIEVFFGTKDGRIVAWPPWAKWLLWGTVFLVALIGGFIGYRVHRFRAQKKSPLTCPKCGSTKIDNARIYQEGGRFYPYPPMFCFKCGHLWELTPPKRNLVANAIASFIFALLMSSVAVFALIGGLEETRQNGKSEAGPTIVVGLIAMWCWKLFAANMASIKAEKLALQSKSSSLQTSACILPSLMKDNMAEYLLSALQKLVPTNVERGWFLGSDVKHTICKNAVSQFNLEAGETCLAIADSSEMYVTGQFGNGKKCFLLTNKALYLYGQPVSRISLEAIQSVAASGNIISFSLKDGKSEKLSCQRFGQFKLAWLQAFQHIAEVNASV